MDFPITYYSLSWRPGISWLLTSRATMLCRIAPTHHDHHLPRRLVPHKPPSKPPIPIPIMFTLPVPDTAWTVERSIRNEQMRQHQQHLNDQLSLIIPQGSFQAIKALLQQGAKLDERAMWAAVGREDVELFEMLVEFGWDIESTEGSKCAVQ